MMIVVREALGWLVFGISGTNMGVRGTGVLLPWGIHMRRFSDDVCYSPSLHSG
jgi:hypothetical protein